MLQRIQTVFLILAALMMALTFLFPTWSYATEGGDIAYQLYTFKLSKAAAEDMPVITYFPYAWVGILALSSIIIAIVEITKFKNRLLQMKLGALNSLFMALTLGFSAYFSGQIMEEVVNPGNYGLGLFLPAGAMFCNIMANRFIRRDDRLVKSVDRIR